MATSWQAVHVRDPESYTEDLKFILNILTMNEVPRVVGGARYLEHKYPGDVDVWEEVFLDADQDTALDMYTDLFTTIVEQAYIIRDKAKVVDIKAGLDERFNYQVTEYTTVEEMEKIISTLYEDDLIHCEERSKLLKSTDEWYTFAEELRLLKTVRWTPKDVVVGHKNLRKGKVLTLREAIGMDALIKVDVIAWLSGRFQAVEFLYQLYYLEDGEYISFLTQDGHFNALINEINKYSRPDKYNPLKIVKRLWNLSMVVNCERSLRAITPLVSSSTAALNQISSDIDALTELYSKHDDVPTNLVYLEVLNFKNRAFNHLSEDDYLEFSELMNNVFMDYLDWSNHGKFNRDKLLAMIKKLDQFLRPLIYSESEDFLIHLQQQDVFCEPIEFLRHRSIAPEQTTYVDGFVAK